MSTCFLVLFLDITKSPPCVAGITLAGESGASLTLPLHRLRGLDLGAAHAPTYSEAKDRMLSLLRDDDWYLGQEWLRPFAEAYLESRRC